MKNYLAVLAALAVATPLAAQTSFGVRGGMTLSTLAPSEEDEELELSYLTGFHLGVTASLGSGGPGLLPVRGICTTGDDTDCGHPGRFGLWRRL